MSGNMNSDEDDLKALALFLDAELDGVPTTAEKIIDRKEGKFINAYRLV